MLISSNTLKALIASIRDSTASLVEAAVTPVKTPPLEPGSEISGEVMEKMPNGRYLVRVGGDLFDMSLPRNTPTGKTLQMTYVGDQPRMTFSIPQSASKGAEVTLSGASRWLGSMSSNTLPPADEEGPTALRTARLFDTPPVDRGTIVQRLRDTVSRSGLFYESHLVRWSENSFPLDELLKEPQGQRSPLMLKEPATASPTTPELPKPQASALQAGSESTATAPEPQDEVEAGPKRQPQDPFSKSGNRSAEPAGPPRGRPDEGESVTNSPQGKALKDVRTEASPPPTRSASEGSRPQVAAGQSPLTAPQLPPSVEIPGEKGLPSTTAPASPAAQANRSPEGEPLPTGQGGRMTAPPQASQDTSVQPRLSQDGKLIEPKTVRPETAFALPANTTADPAAKDSEPGQNAVRSDATRTSLPDYQISTPQARTPRVQTDHSMNRQQAFVPPEPGGVETAAPLSRESSLTGGAKNPILAFEPPDQQTLPIIRQQLQFLQSGQFVWQGESWQGQQLEWMIQREGKQTKQRSGNPWQTSLKLDLPALGPVSAKVHLSGGQVRISIVASNEHSAVKMEAGRKRLMEGMESAGLNLVSMEVRHEPAP